MVRRPRKLRRDLRREVFACGAIRLRSQRRVDEFAYEFDWDAAKAARNLAKHGVDFRQASAVFTDPLALTVFDEAHRQSEER